MRGFEKSKMTLNKQKGNMYDFVKFTKNIIKGICPHQCSYCYMRRYWKRMREPRLDARELNENLGEGNFIFIGSSIDMFAWTIPEEWIDRVLEYCRTYPKNKYLFQSKNPQKFKMFYDEYSKNTVFGTTIESNREYRRIYNHAPSIADRYCSITDVKDDGGDIMLTIEPILDFDTEPFLSMIGDIEPLWVNIGADSQGHNLPEPPKEKVESLITELEKFTEVRTKGNLQRILTPKLNRR